MATDGYIGPYEPITEQENKCSNPACLCENCDCIPCVSTNNKVKPLDFKAMENAVVENSVNLCFKNHTNLIIKCSYNWITNLYDIREKVILQTSPYGKTYECFCKRTNSVRAINIV